MPVDVLTPLQYAPLDMSREPITTSDEPYERICDVRPAEIHDVNGKDAHIPLSDTSTIKQDLYPEIAELLKNRLAIHSKTRPRNALSDVGNEYSGVAGPAPNVHLDNTYVGARTYLFSRLPDEAERLSKTRWALVNVWKPLKTIKRDPLAVLDSTSLRNGDGFGVMVNYYANRRAENEKLHARVSWEITTLNYAPYFRWCYKSGMTPDEVLLLKIADSKNGNRARGFHSSFQDPNMAHIKEPRESVEFRCFVFFEDQPLDGSVDQKLRLQLSL